MFIRYLFHNILLILFFALFALQAKTQDAFTSQLDKSDLFLNPANSTIPFINNIKAKAFISYRDQWNALSPDASYRTAFLVGDFNVFEGKSDAWNLGFIFMNDKADKGNLQQNMVQLSTAYTRKIFGDANDIDNSLFMSFGSSLSINQMNTKLDNLWFGRQFDKNLFAVNTALPSGENFISDNISYINLNLGFRWIYIMNKDRSIASGFSFNNFNRPNISFRENPVSLQTKFVFFLESVMKIGNNISQKPGIIMTIQSPSYQIIPSYQLSFQMNNDDSIMDLGIATRVSNGVDSVILDSVILLFGLSNHEYRIGFSFDFNVSSLSQFTNGNGALEISFDYTIPTK